MAIVFINYHTHACILQKSRHTIRSTSEECSIFDLSIHLGHFLSQSVDSQRKAVAVRNILIYLAFWSYPIPFQMLLSITKAKLWAVQKRHLILSLTQSK